MQIYSESRIAYPREQVYLTYRDRMSEIAAFIPDVREIIVHAREDTDHGVKLHNEWISDFGESSESPRGAHTPD